MADDETVDRVARAIYRCVGNPFTDRVPYWSNLPADAQEFLRRQARAAIEAYEVRLQEQEKPVEMLLASEQLDEDPVPLNGIGGKRELL